MLQTHESQACTGIAFTASDGSRVVARTTEWGNSILSSTYVVVPRNYSQTSYTPSGINGLEFKSRYGYVGISVEAPDFIIEGINETGFSVGLFFFPNYGQYMTYNPQNNAKTLCDMQFVSWALANFSSIDDLKAALSGLDLVSIDSAIGSVHWRISEPGGRMVVLEFENGEAKFHENALGVLTNSPGFEWQMTNLNNYVNLYAGAAAPSRLTDEITLKQFGAGAGMLGLPGDVTPPSRFVRAAFYQTTAPQPATGSDAVMQAFHILSNFNIPIGVEHRKDEIPEDLPSATQWTTASDQSALRFYYRTAWNADIRCIDLKTIDFGKVKYQSHPLDESREQPVRYLKIK